jgi:hypothetical protein
VCLRLTPYPLTKSIPVKWVFKLKTGDDGKPLRYKARIVVCGFIQRDGIDVDETYAPVSKYASLRFLVSHCFAEKSDITHLDIKTSFLNAPLEEIVWCDPPLGRIVPPGHKLRLNKALYGLKQAPRAWNIVLTRTLLTLGFFPSTTDPYLYVMITPSGERIYMNTYVDNLFLAANPSHAKDTIIAELSKAFAITNLGIMTNPLGIQITWNPTTNSILMTQSKLAQSLLEDLQMHDCNPRLLPLDPNTKLTKTTPYELHTAIPETVFPYMKVVGTLLHMVNCTRPDLAQAVGLLCRFNAAPGPTHVAAA